MKSKAFLSLLLFFALFSGCNHPQKVEIINRKKYQISVILSRKTSTRNTIPYDSSFFEKGFECRMTRLQPGKSLVLYTTENDSAINYEKLGFDKIQIESSSGHIIATHGMLPSLFHKEGNDFIMAVN